MPAQPQALVDDRLEYIDRLGLSLSNKKKIGLV